LRQLARSFVISTTAESSMNKKLVSLAVAAAIAAPTAVMAEAVLYGKLHQSIDYADIKNAVPGTPQTVTGWGYEGVIGDTVSINATDYGPYTFLVTGTGGGGTREFVGPGGNAVGGPGVGYNLSDIPVSATYVDANGMPQEVVIQPGQSFSFSQTASFDSQVAGTPVVQNRNFSLTDGSGRVLLRPGTLNQSQGFKGWGLSGHDYRRYTTVNPNTGIGGPINDRANRLGVKGSEDLGNGLKAVYQVEFGLSISGSNSVSFRNSFVGLAGDWGTLLAGRHDTPLKISTGKLDLFSDTMADYNGTIGFDDNRTDQTVAYISPSFSGFSLAAAAVTGGGTGNVENDSLSGMYSLAAIYKNGPFYGSLAYESIGSENYNSAAVQRAGKSGCINNLTGRPTGTCQFVSDDFKKWRIGLGLLDWNGFTLTAIYENQDDLPAGQQTQQVGYIDQAGNVSLVQESGIKSQNLWQIQAGYAFGNNMFKAMYGAVDRDADKPLSATRGTLSTSNLRKDLSGDRSAWAVGFDHNFSKRTKAYVLYTDVTDDYSNDYRFAGTEWSGFSLGMIHKF
jgi:predicted porin